jgi:hypothetical protein
MRIVQKKGERGSQKWIQEAVSRHTNYLNRKIQEACALKPNEIIEWVSPPEEDDYAEYRDCQFVCD